MSQYYRSQRKRGLYDPSSEEPYRLSRSQIDLFMNCPRCFYLDRRLGVARPPGYPFTLNSAVDELLKREFDIHRAKGTKHPLQTKYDIDAIPLAHEKIDEWRDALRRGVVYHHANTNFRITGGIDDVWVKTNGELIVVDYKATSKKDQVNLDAEWQIGYKRQLEVYQWLFRRNGFRVSDTGYFVYCNGNSDAVAFDGKLEFDVSVIPYAGDDSWIESALLRVHACLNSEEVPAAGADCDYCSYREAAARHGTK
jgi:CRISPR/Cas system-associated exonuclease Cas4 (RecB family)